MAADVRILAQLHSRRRLASAVVLLSGMPGFGSHLIFAGCRPAARVEPTLKIAFENSDAPFRKLDRRRSDPIGNLPLQGSSGNFPKPRGFVVVENFQVGAVLFVACRKRVRTP